MNRFSLAATLVAIITASSLIQPDSSASGDDWRAAIAETVSGDDIVQTILGLQSFGTRDFHTQESLDAALLIRQWMEEIGLATETQEFIVDGITAVNVIGTMNAENIASGVWLFGAHYDSRNTYVTSTSEAENITAPGADDNASGIGAMLEIAEVLAACENYVATTRFVAFGAEERGFIDHKGLAGSSAFVESEVTAGIEYEGVFIMDMIGYRANAENHATVIHNNASEPLANSILNALGSHEFELEVETISNESVRYSDHASFWAGDYPSVLVIEELQPQSFAPLNPYYHTEWDTAEKLSAQLMEEITSTLVWTILDLTDQGEDSYSFPSSAMVAAAGAIILTVAVVVVLRGRGNKGGLQ